jgi:hypothetical protein
LKYKCRKYNLLQLSEKDVQEKEAITIKVKNNEMNKKNGGETTCCSN